jgi:hypothetical protein
MIFYPLVDLWNPHHVYWQLHLQNLLYSNNHLREVFKVQITEDLQIEAHNMVRPY